MRRGEPVQFTMEAVNRNSETAWLQLNGECIDWIDGDPGFLIVYIDVTVITRQKELQKKTNKQLRLATAALWMTSEAGILRSIF